MSTMPEPTPIATLPPLDDAGAGDISDYRANSLWRLTMRRLFRQRSAVVGFILLVILVGSAIFAPIIAPYNPEQPLIGIENVTKRQGPCIHLLGCPPDKPQHIMGVDGNFRDVFSRIIYGTRISLSVGLLTVSFAVLVGTFLGAISG
ncbi:MAG TPA: hypothetical protein PKJ56_03045, partial [Promineifilum sp.]|nr:hypothetical protein [Promineifilum sp.]